MQRLRASLKPRPSVVALLVQVTVFFLLTLPLSLGVVYAGGWPTPFAAALLQGMVAALVSARVLPRWWMFLQAIFPILVVLGLLVHLSPLVWLGAFVVVWLINRNSVGERVPLYLSGRFVPETLSTILPACPFRFLDLGCGLGGVLARLADKYPTSHFEGIESAPLPWLIAWLRLMRRNNGRVLFGDLWALPLAEYQVVYCFLSPAPMAALWAKACAELRPGSLFVSNTFAISAAPAPHQVLELPDHTGPLYVWRM